ncbi:hypothetical protein EUTSA_v10019156mg [Eutrema salsugineum]|uniref:Late embryogenesis abundant protein LEA-2 subgroup domain-containing protein n=1 Tax=Eutrema salsugineum TaxID=72664 RepID=V4KAV4_EUTSA|nr:hypothetical protein EUTSA_v10019156mg [Eutrema salsugineum]
MESNATSLWGNLKRNSQAMLVIVIIAVVFITLFYILAHLQEIEEKRRNHVPDITIPSMDFTVLNITKTRLSVKWDLLIRIPGDLPGYYMCLEGDFKVFIVYEGVTIADSSIQRPWWSKLLRVSLVASERDMDGAIVENIMEDIKERGETRFGSRLLLPDCKYGTSGKMNYACDEAMLRFESGSKSNATLFGNHPNCLYLP